MYFERASDGTKPVHSWCRSGDLNPDERIAH